MNRPQGTGGGLGILIKNDVQYRNLKLNSFQNGVLEVQAIRIYINSTESYDILNFYNPNKNVSVNEFRFQVSYHKTFWKFQSQISEKQN